MGPKKKEPFNPFKSRSITRGMEAVDQLKEEDAGPGEFRDTSVTFTPSYPKAPVSLTLQFRCTVKIVRGDTITFRLAGFKGNAPGVFTLEKRPHPKDEFFHTHFFAYWTSESSPKGGPPAQSIILQCREPVYENALVVVGVPDTVKITAPDKLAANSPKLKIEGNIKHAESVKIPKAPVDACNEVPKKRPVEEDLAEIENSIKDIISEAHFETEEQQIAQEMTQQEADKIWETARELTDLRMGLQWKVELGVFKSYEESAPLAKIITENYLASNKKKISMAVHKELAHNLGVKIGAIVILEDAFYALHGSYYPKLSRAAILVLRLFTCEAPDINRLLGLANAQCIHREVSSAFRTMNTEVLAKWTNFLGVLMTCPDRLTNVDPKLIPKLYRGVKDLPAESVQQLLQLKKGDWYLFPHITTFISLPTLNTSDENFFAPDNAVLFEVQGAVDGIEIGDASQYPEDNEWMLPMFSSFSVESVSVVDEKNHLTHVVLRMRGALAGALRDEHFPENDRTMTSMALRKASTEAEIAGQRSQSLAKCIYSYLKLHERRYLHPQHLLHCQYLEKFADTQRLSQARITVEENVVKWQQCLSEAAMGPDGIQRPASWDNINKKMATTIETFFLKSTRAQKVFVTPDGLNLDFTNTVFQIDFGKGPRRMRRLVGKHVSHPFTKEQ